MATSAIKCPTFKRVKLLISLEVITLINASFTSSCKDVGKEFQVLPLSLRCKKRRNITAHN